MHLLDTSVFGLPVHPLVVHVVVVLLPLGALGLAAVVLLKRLRERYATLAMAVVTAALGAAIVAKSSGELLDEIIRVPEEHEELGERTVMIALALTLVGWVWWWLQRRHDEVRFLRGHSGLVERAAGGLAVLLALGAVVVTTLTGHSGAAAVWTKKLSAASATPAPVVTPTPTVTSPAPSATPSAFAAATPVAYTMEQVRQHNTQQSCWAAVDREVYDLTPWIVRHPGGQQRILNLCGTDASAAFRAQHGTSQKPNLQLAGFRIGVLA